MKVRFGDKTIERPFRELALEALGTPLLIYVFWQAVKRGWAH